MTLFTWVFFIFAADMAKLPTWPSNLPLSAELISTPTAIDKSSLVIVGRIKEIVPFGESRHTNRGQVVQPWRITVDVELVVSGRSPGNSVEYYLYNTASSVSFQNGTLERLKEGERRIFLLRSEGPILRSVTDLYASSLPFPRSRVPRLPGRAIGTVHERIARLLLTQDPDESAREFAESLDFASRRAIELVSHQSVSRLLAPLLRSRSAEVRSAACVANYELLFGDDTCLIAMLQHDVDPGFARRIRDDRRQRAYLRQRTEDAFRHGRDCPLIWYAAGVDRSDSSSVRGFFRFLAQHPDPLFREAAKRELVRLEGHAR